MTDRELLQEALDLAEEARCHGDSNLARKAIKTIAAIKEVLAQPEQEPVSWTHDCAVLLANDIELWIDKCPHCSKPRTAPQPAAQPEQEPIAWALPRFIYNVDGFAIGIDDPELSWGSNRPDGIGASWPLYTAPQPAVTQPVPLTDAQIEEVRQRIFSTGNPYCPVDNQAMRKAARAIEAAHNIK